MSAFIVISCDGPTGRNRLNECHRVQRFDVTVTGIADTWSLVRSWRGEMGWESLPTGRKLFWRCPKCVKLRAERLEAKRKVEGMRAQRKTSGVE